MGTLLDITLYAPSREEGRKILDETFATAEHLNSVLSTWTPESPVSEFNRASSLQSVPVDPDLYSIVTRSRALSEITDGAFTIGVRPLVEIWERAAQHGTLPSKGEINRARELISPDNFVTTPPASLAKRKPGAKIETGGIGKGYAVDAMVELLHARGIKHAFINFGRSSMAAIGAPPMASGWKVEVALTDRTTEGTIELRNETLSVSRARGTPFIINGVAYAHVFDPRSGMPVATSRGAAIRGPSATDGEAFVKYLVIRGAPSSSVAQRWGDVEWIVRDEHGIERSSHFSKPPEASAATVTRGFAPRS